MQRFLIGGQVVIPARLRKKYKINIGDRVNVIEKGDGIKTVPVESDNDTVESLVGVFSKYVDNGKIDEESVNKATDGYFMESAKDEIY